MKLAYLRNNCGPTMALRLAGPAAALLLCLLLPASAQAIDRNKCDDDGVSEVPGFATARDSDGCLLLDPGNGDALIPIQWEVLHRTGVSDTVVDGGENPSVPVLDLGRPDECGNQNEGCTFLVWDTVLDNYSDRIALNDDLLFIGAGHRTEYMLIKDSFIMNTATCKGGVGWSGPNGLSCSSGNTSASHVDGIQLRGQPVNDGWFVMQDTVLVNGYNLHFLAQASSQYGRLGSFVMQGGEFGRRQAIGQATTWIDDCELRRDQSNGNGSDICPEGRAAFDNDMREIWLIDVFGTTEFNLSGNNDKIVIINSGCDKNSCNGGIGYNRGWPHPLHGYSTSGPGTCPNGSIGSYKGNSAYCYTSLENAAQSHKLPPFVQFSNTGWANPSGGTSQLTPPAPTLLP